MTDNDLLLKKAKRRIKRFIQTQEPVARVRQINDNTYVYAARHHGHLMIFKVDSIGRLRQMTTSN